MKLLGCSSSMYMVSGLQSVLGSGFVAEFHGVPGHGGRKGPCPHSSPELGLGLRPPGLPLIAFRVPFWALSPKSLLFSSHFGGSLPVACWAFCCGAGGLPPFWGRALQDGHPGLAEALPVGAFLERFFQLTFCKNNNKKNKTGVDF